MTDRHKLDQVIAVIVEGGAEAAILDILLDYDKLIFRRDDILEGRVLRTRNARTFESTYLVNAFPKGSTTKDKVFLLSLDEAARYFSNNEARQCKPTAYVVNQGAHVDKDLNTCWWWLRSLGCEGFLAAGVNYGGFVNAVGFIGDDDDVGVRPALWLNL